MKILIINDDPAMTDLLLMMLASTKAVIKCANSGSEGLSLLQDYTPDIVLIDLMLPETDTWKVTSEIRKTSSIPILVMSVIDNPVLVARALDKGADDFLIKPVPMEVLIAHINNLTRRKQINTAPALVSTAFQTVYK